MTIKTFESVFLIMMILLYLLHEDFISIMRIVNSAINIAEANTNFITRRFGFCWFVSSELEKHLQFRFYQMDKQENVARNVAKIVLDDERTQRIN